MASPGNARVKALRRLHRRRERADRGLTLLEGPNLVAAARAAAMDLVEVWASDGSGDVACSPAVIAALSTTKTPQSPVGVMRIPAPAPLGGANTLFLWDVADEGNAGALIRAAAAFGWDVAYTAGSVDVWSPKVLRAGAGGHFATRLAERAAPPPGLVPVAAVSDGGRDPRSLPPGPYALLIGNEARGLPPEAMAEAIPVTIPTSSEIDSLNAAVAGGILMWELGRPH